MRPSGLDVPGERLPNMKTIKLVALAIALACVGCGTDDSGLAPDGRPSVGKYAPVTAQACAARVSTSVVDGTPCAECWSEGGGARVDGCAAEVCNDGFRPRADGSCADGSDPTPRLCIASPDACPLKGAQ